MSVSSGQFDYTWRCSHVRYTSSSSSAAAAAASSVRWCLQRWHRQTKTHWSAYLNLLDLHRTHCSVQAAAQYGPVDKQLWYCNNLNTAFNFTSFQNCSLKFHRCDTPSRGLPIYYTRQDKKKFCKCIIYVLIFLMIFAYTQYSCIQNMDYKFPERIVCNM